MALWAPCWSCQQTADADAADGPYQRWECSNSSCSVVLYAVVSSTIALVFDAHWPLARVFALLCAVYGRLNQGQVIGASLQKIWKSSNDFNEDMTNESANVAYSTVRLWKLDCQKEWRNTSWHLWDERHDKDSAGFVDSKENKWVGFLTKVE